MNKSGRSIYLSHDLTFIGNGSLTISGSIEGIVTSGNVYFTGPNITILSSQGVSYADKLLISCGNITIDGSASYNNKYIGVNEMIVTYTFVQDERIHGWEKYKYSLGDGDGNRVSKAILVTVAEDKWYLVLLQ